jgi:hypothetical protein
MYAPILFIHSWFRWFAFGGVLVVFVKELRAYTTGRPWHPSDLTWMKAAAQVLSAQFAIGVLLYATSPYIHSLFSDLSATMHDRVSRFFLVEHEFTMLIAVAATHMGAAIARKGATDQARHRRAAIFFGIAGLLMVYAIPWWRPLFRLGN